MKITQIIAASVLGLAASAVSANVIWTTDPNTLAGGDPQEISFLNFAIDSAMYDLVFYDAGSNPSVGATSLVIPSLTGIVEVTPDSAPNYIGVYDLGLPTQDAAFLGATPEFELALYDPAAGTYTEVISFTTLIAGNSYAIQFDNGVTGQLFGVDLMPVPVPAAVWLFGSGLLGLVGVARRRA
jgi:hypothetical protein